ARSGLWSAAYWQSDRAGRTGLDSDWTEPKAQSRRSEERTLVCCLLAVRQGGADGTRLRLDGAEGAVQAERGADSGLLPTGSQTGRGGRDSTPTGRSRRRSPGGARSGLWSAAYWQSDRAGWTGLDSDWTEPKAQ